MLKDWFGHHHGHGASPVHRLPAAVKLGAALALIAGTILIPVERRAWFGVVAAFLLLVALLARISFAFLLKRLLVLSPFVLGVALVNAFQPALRGGWVGLAAKSSLCLFTVILLSNTTSFGKILGVLRRARVPLLLLTPLALMHRYLFVLLEESERMRRARASRTFTQRRRARWKMLGTVVGQLFLRASERAERIYAAMCARGWQ